MILIDEMFESPVPRIWLAKKEKMVNPTVLETV